MFRYGKTLEERKKNFKHIILQIKKDFGTESLNDNTMNPKGNGFNVVIPKKVPNPIDACKINFMKINKKASR